MKPYVTSILRPIRLAVATPVATDADLLKAIMLNTMLWGGQQNPILPIFSEIPDVIQNALGGPFDTTQRLSQELLKRHDPDGIVTLSDTQIDFGLPSVSAAAFWKVEFDPMTSQIGVGLFELLRTMLGRELHFVRRRPIALTYVNAAHPLSLAAAFNYGALPLSLASNFVAIASGVGNEVQLDSPAMLFEQLQHEYVTPARVSNYGLKANSDITLACAHLDSLVDMIFCWNYRASGQNVIFVPVEYVSDNEVLSPLIEFLVANDVSRINVFRAPSITDDELRTFLAAFSDYQLALVPFNSGPFFAHDHSRGAPFSGDVTRQSATVEDDRMELRFAAPPLRGTDRLRTGLRYANDISISVRSDSDFPPNVVPFGIKRFWGSPFPELTRLHDGVAWHGDFRASRDGISIYSSFFEASETIPSPDATTIIREYFHLKGYKTSISSDGLALRRLLRLAGSGIRFLVHPDIRKLLAQFDSDATLKLGTATSILGSDAATSSLRILLDARLLEAGLIVQCESCGGHVFFEIGQLSAHIQCRRCQADIRLRLEAPGRRRLGHTGCCRRLRIRKGGRRCLA